MNKYWTIYCHTHIESGRRYIGLTAQTWQKRWKNHVCAANSARGGRWHFPNAIRKYGKDAFSHEILEVCTILEKANAAEIKWIEFYKTRDPQFGFNLAKGGDHIPSEIRKNPWNDPEFRARACLAAKAKWQDPKYRAANLAISRARLAKATKIASLNKVQSRPEVKQQLSEIMKRVAATPEGHAQRIAAAHPGKILTAEHRAKISANDASKRPEVAAKISISSKAAWSDSEKRKRMTLAQVGKKLSPETIAKMIAANTGRKLSDEAKLKISEALTGRPRQTHCQRGHAMEGNNILITGNRHRCRMCRNMRQRHRRIK